MKILTQTTTAFVIILLAASCFSQQYTDVLYMKDGTIVRGKIIEQLPDKTIKLRISDGTVLVYSLDQIDRMTVEASELRDYKQASYPELGINLGTPGGVNLAFGYWFGEFGVRASGMDIGTVAGIQAGIGYKLSDNENRSHVLSFILGSSRIETTEYYLFKPDRTITHWWTYYGVAYELNLSGFFLHAGVSGGSGDYTTPQASFQIGYMHRFLPD